MGGKKTMSTENNGGRGEEIVNRNYKEPVQGKDFLVREKEN